MDRDYRFTGLKYAHADGRGRVAVHNPFIGQSLVLDSSDYRDPSRSESSPMVFAELPSIDGTAGQKPNISALTADATSVYAAHYGVPEFFQPSTVSGEVVRLDRNTLQVTGRAKVGRAPLSLALHENTRRLWVVNYQDHSLTVVDADDLSVVTTIQPAGFGLRGVAASQRFNRMFVAQWGQRRLLVYDATTLQQTGVMSGLELSGNIRVDEASNRLFVLVRRAGGVQQSDLVEYEIGPDGQTELRRCAVPDQVSVEAGLAVDGDRCAVLTRVPGTGEAQQVVIVDRSTFTPVGTIPLAKQGVSVSSSASQRQVVVATQYSVDVRDSHHGQRLRRIEFGDYVPQRVVLTDEATGATWYGSSGSARLTLIGSAIGGLGG